MYNMQQLQLEHGSDDVNEFLEKHFTTKDMSLDDAASLAIAAINLKVEQKRCNQRYQNGKDYN